MEGRIRYAVQGNPLHLIIPLDDERPAIVRENAVGSQGIVLELRALRRAVRRIEVNVFTRADVAIRGSNPLVEIPFVTQLRFQQAIVRLRDRGV